MGHKNVQNMVTKQKCRTGDLAISGPITPNLLRHHAMPFGSSMIVLRWNIVVSCSGRGGIPGDNFVQHFQRVTRLLQQQYV